MRPFGNVELMITPPKAVTPVGELERRSSLLDPFALTRRHFFSTAARGLGAMALSSLLPRSLLAATSQQAVGGLPGFPNFAPKAKRIIYLFQSGAPSQMDLF